MSPAARWLEACGGISQQHYVVLFFFLFFPLFFWAGVSDTHFGPVCEVPDAHRRTVAAGVLRPRAMSTTERARQAGAAKPSEKDEQAFREHSARASARNALYSTTAALVGAVPTG